MFSVWRGISGYSYEFEIYPPSTDWFAVGGIYVMAAVFDYGRKAQALYVGKTNDFSTRIPDHEVWPLAVRRGAVEIHARVVRNAVQRAQIERDLIAGLSPPLNVQHRIDVRAKRIALARQLQDHR